MLAPLRAPTKKSTIFRIVDGALQYPTVTATSCHGSSARFDRDIRHVIIDVLLLCGHVGARGCRPRRVDFLRIKSACRHNPCDDVT